MTEQQSEQANLHYGNPTLDLQDYIDILNLIKGTAIQFDQAERAVEIKKKLEANIERLSME